MLVGGAVAAAILIAIIATVLATSGGGGSPIAVSTTTPVTEPLTTTPVTTPTTTSTGGTVHVTIPAGGNLSAGDKGTMVLALQKALKQLGADIGTPDGKFGQKTQDAVKAFQTAHTLTPDGIVGETTATAINDAVASAAG